MMKRKMMPLVCFLALSVAACKKSGVEKSGNKFDLSTGKIAMEIPVSAVVGTDLKFGSVRHRLNLDSLVRSVRSTYNRTNLKSVTLRYCTLTIQNETSVQHLGNFSALALSAVAADRSEFPVAALTDHKDTAEVTLTIRKSAERQLASLFVNDTITYQLSGKLRRPLTQPVAADMVFVYDISVGE